MRVAALNMTDTSQQCPGELVERNETGIRQCRIEGQSMLPRSTFPQQMHCI